MSIVPVPSPPHPPLAGKPTPLHRALDAVTSLTLDVQRMRRDLGDGAVVTAEQRDVLRRIDEQVQRLRAVLAESRILE